MRDTFLNLSYRAKGGMDKKMLAHSLNSVNEKGYLWRNSKREKPVAYILNEKFHPCTSKSSKHSSENEENHI